MTLRFYFDDDSGSLPLLRALRGRAIDAVRAEDTPMAGMDDASHLRFSSSEGRVLVTANKRDFARLHRDLMRAGGTHGGIVIRTQLVSVGELARRLSELSARVAPEDMTNEVVFLTEAPRRH
ncbi:MAG: DUF5615 family PIN-like protein [Chloroflexi bacterium]|nr:DUF5615 family PIN-like protein [Chloroflexota bacterium]